ncbi:MAG: hypothetical protein AAB415_03450 [Patescibacteria group bacterium]
MPTPISKTYDRREWPTLALFILVILAMSSYVYLTQRVVFQAVGKQVARSEIAELKSEVTTLEATALTQSSRLTLELAYARGFTNSPDQTFYIGRLDAIPLLVSWFSDGNE